jgi:predicted  nucleic acid-binding Zn-ribbon protein
MHLGDTGFAMAMNVEAEIRDLKRRVTNQVKGVHRDLLAFQEKTEQRFEKIDGRFEQVDGRINKVDGRLDRVEGRLDHIEKGIKDLRHDMPGIVGDTMREVLSERDKTSRK